MRRLTIIFLFCVGTVGAADWCETYGDYQLYAKSALGKELGDKDGVMADTSINQITREAVIFLVPALKACKFTDTITTTYAAGTYSLDSLLVGIDAVYWADDDSTKTLTYMPKEQWYQLALDHLNEKRGYEHRPSYYDYSDTKLWVYPVPMKYGTADTIRVDAWRRVPDLAAQDSLDIIPQKYRPAVGSYLVWKLALAVGDPREARLYEDYAAKIAAIAARREVATSDK